MTAFPQRSTPAKMMKTGDVARRSGGGIEALRVYESRGLLDPAGRTGSGYRLYDSSALDRLAFIKKAQPVGFTLDETARITSRRRTESGGASAESFQVFGRS